MNLAVNTPIQVTQSGLEELKRELDELLNTKRPYLVDRLANARSQGDLSENSDYHNAKDELEFLDGRIAELEDVLKNAVVVADGGGGNGVSVGTKVTVKTNGTKKTYHIVGEWEADPAKLKISHASPLGQALLGKKVGQKVEVEAPAGKIIYEVLSVE
jgi:transcription elongation factor GreA